MYEELIPIAIQAIREGEIDSRKCKHASIIVRRGVPIAVGINRYKTHPLAKEFGYRHDEMHSELDAFIKVRHYGYSDMVLVNFRVKKNNSLGMAHPCSLCLPWCRALFKDIWYSSDTGIKRL